MKECKYCGTKYKDELDVCPNCGGNLIVTAQEIAQAAELAQKEKENQQRSVVDPQNHLKKLIGIIAGVIATIIVIVVVASYAHNHRAVNGDLSRADMAEAYEQGMMYYNGKDYASAIVELGKVSMESKYYDEASAILQEAVAIYSDDALSKASVYANAGDYKMACVILENALQVVPANSTLTAELTSYQETFRNQLRSSTLEAVEDSIAENDYPTAIQTLSSTLDVLNSDIELNALFEKYRSEYRDMIIAQADNSLENEGYEAAIAVANEGLAVLANDSVLLQAIERYETYTPVWLCDIDYFDKSGDWVLGETTTDNLGISHQHSIYVDSEWNRYITFRLDEKYKTLSGMWYMKYEYRTYGGSTLYIYGDDDLLWQGTVSGGIEPMQFTIDVTGVSVLKIAPEYIDACYSCLWSALGEVSVQP